MLLTLSRASSPHLLLSLRPQDPIPKWITHLIWLTPSLQVGYQGSKDEVLGKISDRTSETLSTKTFPESAISLSDLNEKITISTAASTLGCNVGKPVEPPANGEDLPELTKPVVQMKGVLIRYGDKQVLGGWTQKINGEIEGGLRWTVKRGERWGVFGPNGMYRLQP